MGSSPIVGSILRVWCNPVTRWSVTSVLRSRVLSPAPRKDIRMKLQRALEIARSCGLDTVGEAILNIELHSSSLFTYSELDAELKELYAEAEGIDINTPIKSLLPTEESMSEETR